MGRWISHVETASDLDKPSAEVEKLQVETESLN